MGSIWGRQVKISLFGESHGPGIGVVLDGLPAGEKIDLAEVASFMARRAPGRTPWSTRRQEPDQPEILSGLYRGQTTGTPLAAVIYNRDRRSHDYESLAGVPRPGHADLTGQMRYRGANDPRGGGHFSGRLTAPLTFAGAVCSQILARKGTKIAAHIYSIGSICDRPVDPAAPDQAALLNLKEKEFPVLADEQGEAMVAAVEAARLEADSLGGSVEVLAWGYPAGIGDPMMGGLESVLASLYYAIPAVKGVSFGAGFDVCERRGSVNNDSPVILEQRGQKCIRLRSNHAGGIDGGISNGMPIVARLAFKPTPSIGLEQETVDLTELTNTTVVVKGRHDPCLVPRAVPVVAAATAIGLLDCYLVQYGKEG